MSKRVRTLGIVLSLGAAGCAGFGAQHASSLTAQFQREQGLDNLWNASEADPKEGLELRAYGDQGLTSLWEPAESASTLEGRSGLYEGRGLGDLWYPASVYRSREVQESDQVVPARGSRRGGSARRKQAGRSQIAAR
jgi:hypothetical protein